MGLLGMFGDKLVTSSSWKCSATNTDENFNNKNFDDSGWGSAAEEGEMESYLGASALALRNRHTGFSLMMYTK